MKEVKLKKGDTDTVFVDDVDVSKGVYFKWHSGAIHYLVPCDGGYDHIGAFNGTKSSSKIHPSLLDAVQSKSPDSEYYTLSGKRIVTERELCVDDLKDTDHVGFVTHEKKGHVIYVGEDRFLCVPAYECETKCNPAYNRGQCYGSLKDAINSKQSISELHLFPTRKKLYKWLSE